MNIEEFRTYCLSKKGTSECLPFDDNTLVFKVMDKMFSLGNLEGPLSVNLKCDPEKAIELREQHEGIKPGYHMSKKHWNTVEMDGSVPLNLVKDLIDHSYELVVSKLTRKLKEELANL